MEGFRELALVEALRSPLSAGGGFPGGVTPSGLGSPPGWTLVRKPGTTASPSCRETGRVREGACSEAKAPPPPARKEAATAPSGDPGPCPYMGSRKRLARLPYVIISKFSRGSLALPVAGRFCPPAGGWGRGEGGERGAYT